MTNAPSASAIRVTLASVPPVACWCRVRVSYGRWHEGSKNNTGLIGRYCTFGPAAPHGLFRAGEVRCFRVAGQLSACIITYNEGDRIEACLRSVLFCDEIVVVDSHSTDSTRALASASGARVIERDWPGYRSQKQFAVDNASNEWVLCLDADE